MLATSGAFEDAQARLAPYAANLLGEFGRGVVVRVRRAGLRCKMLNGVAARRSAPSGYVTKMSHVNSLWDPCRPSMSARHTWDTSSRPWS